MPGQLTNRDFDKEAEQLMARYRGLKGNLYTNSQANFPILINEDSSKEMLHKNFKNTTKVFLTRDKRSQL